MKGLMPNPTHWPYKRVKKFLVTAAIVICLLFPELLWHKLTFILHIFYEVASFLLEEGLIHGLGMQKYYAQMMVFYFFWLLGIVMFAGFLRQLPHLIHTLKARLLLLGWRIKSHLIEVWLSSTIWQKTKFIFLQLLLMASGLMFLLV